MAQELIKIEENLLSNNVFKHCKFYNYGLEINANTSYEEWEKIGDILMTIDRCNKLWIGDWLNFGENNYEEWSQKFDPEHKTSIGSLYNLKYVCNKIPISRRRETLHPSIYQEIASLEEKQQEEVMDVCEKDKLTIQKIRDLVKDIKKKEKIKEFEKFAKGFKDDDIKIYNDDFKNVAKKIEDESVDLVLTDPPYPEEFLPLWEKMFEVADRILKPSKFLVCYANHQNLDKIFQLKNNLKYYWTFKLDFTLKPIAKGRNLIATWKPVLIFQKLPFKKIEETIEDNVKELTPFDNSERDMHEDNWGQSIGKFEYLIEKFSKPNDLVFEPFAGTGTTLIACQRHKRKCIGAEIDKQYIDLIKGRLNEGNQI